jgi:integrase
LAEKKEAKKKKLPPGVRERNGRYTYRYSVEVVKDGKRTRKQKETESYKTAQEAYDAGILIKADQLKGKLVDEKNLTLRRWGDWWLTDYEIEREARPRTLRNRKTGLVSLSKHVGEHTKLRDITSEDCQQWINNLKKNGKKQNTLKEYYQSVKILFNDAVRKEVIAINPMDKVIMPAFKLTVEAIEFGAKNLPKYLEKSQLKHLLRIARFRGGPQEYNLFTVLAYTGLRIGELQALKWTDFNRTEKWISVTKTMADRIKGGGYVLGPPKNNSSIRKVTIGKTAIQALESQEKWQEQFRKDHKLTSDDGFIFWSIKYPGYPADDEWANDRFTDLLNKAELPTSLTVHSLRHTHVTLLAEAREELAIIQERLGHKNDEITRRVYLHVTEGQKKLTPDKFERVMDS